jgi:hypothetical protein
MHAQQQVLNALQALLAAGSTVASTRVFLDRVDPLQPDELPAISIEEDPEGEVAEAANVGGLDRRDLTVLVTCILAHTTTAAADARSFGLAVEKLVAPSTALSALCKLGWRMTSSRQINNGEGDRLLAARQQTWRFSYLVNPDAPDTIF